MIISTFRSIGKAYVDLQADLPWEHIVELLTEHHSAIRKEDVPMFNLAEFKKRDDPFVQLGRRYHGTVIDGQFVRSPAGTYDEIPGTVRRCRGNVVGITGIVLDVDKSMTISEAIETFEPIEYVLYTTFRHTIDQHKFRIVIPFSRQLLANDIAGRQASIVGTFPGVDSASFTVSQSFYFHSGNSDSIVYHNKGIMLDPYDNFEYQEPKIYIPSESQSSEPLDDLAAWAYREAVMKSLLSCSNMHYAGTNGSNHAVLTLISICRSIRCSFEEFDYICSRISAPDSQLTNPNVRRSAWTGWTGDRIRRENRDSFIRTYGGRPVSTDAITSTAIQNIRYRQRNDRIKELEQKLRSLQNV